MGSKITQLPNNPTPAADALIEIVSDPEGTPANENTGLAQLFSQFQKWVFGSDAGSTDSYVVTLSPAPAAYVPGQHYRFKANTANTGACTVNFNGLGAKTIKKAAGGITTDLADNDIRAGQWVDLVYDGTNMQMQSQLGSSFIKPDGSVAFTADQSMGSHKLTNVTDPASAQDAATKAYVDSTVGGGTTPTGSAGGTLGGTYPNPTVNTDGSTLETNSNALRIKDGGVTAAKLATNVKTTTLFFLIDGGGAVIATGVKGDLGPIDFACTINAVTMLADQSGSIVVDIWKDTYANFAPTDADSITASAVPTISSAIKSQDATLTGWTTSISAGDTLRFNVDSVTSIQRVTIALKVTLT